MKLPILEAKVTLSTLVTFLASLGGALLNALVSDSTLLGSLPSWCQFLVIAGSPTILTFISGYVTPHTHRPDLTPPQHTSTP